MVIFLKVRIVIFHEKENSVLMVVQISNTLYIIMVVPNMHVRSKSRIFCIIFFVISP
jgi:hypothetical protein